MRVSSLNIKDQISSICIEPVISARLNELTDLLDARQKALKKAPAGTLRISRSKNSLQYYHIISFKDKKGKYIPVKNKALIQHLAQKFYDYKLVITLKKETKLLKEILKKYTAYTRKTPLAENVYENMNKNKQSLVTPVRLTDAQFAAAWQAEVYTGKAFQPDSPELYTARGERVRSKSELIIADTLNRLGIPYKYERPLPLLNGEGRLTVYPDFTCLNLRSRQEFIWEHFGMLDDPNYAETTVAKLKNYADNRIFPGTELIISTETPAAPINTREVEKIIKKYLM